MSTKTEKAGGSAFPIPSLIHPNGEVVWGTDGMSLRDYFAAQAPISDISQMIPNSIDEFCKVLGIPVSEYKSQEHYMPFIVTLRYRWADAMLAERSKVQ